MTVHPTAVVSVHAKIGERTIIGPMCEIGANAVIGDDCLLIGCCVEGTVNDRTKVWRYAHIMEGAYVGMDCQVCNGAIVLTDAVVGNRCDIQLWAGIARKAKIEDDVFIGPNVVFCNAKRPDRTCTHDDLLAITVKSGSSVGANSSLMAGVTVGRGATVGAGTVVTKDVPDYATITGKAGVVRE